VIDHWSVTRFSFSRGPDVPATAAHNAYE
jgi:hypothetical protein